MVGMGLVRAGDGRAGAAAADDEHAGAGTSRPICRQQCSRDACPCRGADPSQEWAPRFPYACLRCTVPWCPDFGVGQLTSQTQLTTQLAPAKPEGAAMGDGWESTVVGVVSQNSLTEAAQMLHDAWSHRAG